MRWDYPLLDINPVFPGLGEFIIIIIILSLYLVVNGVNFMLWEKKMKKKKKKMRFPNMCKPRAASYLFQMADLPA